MSKNFGSQLCFSAFDTLAWYPGKMTTFILPVIEIEQIIIKLTNLRDKTISLSKFPTTAPIQAVQPSNDYEKLNKMVNNWNTVLSNYRKQSEDLTAPFENEIKVYNMIVSKFYDYQQTQHDFQRSGAVLSKLIKSIEMIISLVNLVGPNLLGKAATLINPAYYVQLGARTIETILFLELSGVILNYCEGYLRNWGEFRKYANNICKDFDSKKWQYFTDFFDNACNIKIGFDSTDDKGQSDEKATYDLYYGQLCKRSDPVNEKDYPGNKIESSGVNQQLFQFLRSNKAYLTFGAQTTTNLIWTSTVSSGYSHTTQFSTNQDSEIDSGSKVELKTGFKSISKAGVKFVTSQKIDIKQDSTQTETNMRSVVVNLGDPDQGIIYI